MRRDLPSGTVTFLFTDVEGSTRLLHELGAEAYAEALAEHRRVIREACTKEDGVEVDTQGDAFFFAFPTAPGALAAAQAFTDTLAAGPIQVRVGLHTGTPLLTEEGYVGQDVHRAARIASAGHGGQVLVAASTAILVDAELRDLGEHRFKDLAAPERVHQVGDHDFPALRSLYRTNLPVPATLFLGRERELSDVIGLVSRDDIRLLTLTGPGGTGKTRLALQAVAEVSERFPDGVWWVPLGSLRDPALVLAAIAHALEIREEPGVELGRTLTAQLAGKRLLVLVDNVEHLLPDAAAAVATLRDVPGLRVVVTSRERLQLQGEIEFPVAALGEADGFQLLAARAAGVGVGLERTPSTMKLVESLDGLPLALELAAARLKLFSPEQLLERLSARLDLFRGSRDADPRQQTLRATIEWSHDLLTEEERLLFRRLSVFAGGCTYEAAEAVVDAGPETIQSLLDKSLVRRRDGADRTPRYWMLETIREFAVERLAEDGDADQLRAVHARWYAEQTASMLTRTRAYELDALAASREDLANVRLGVAYATETRDPELLALYVFGIWVPWLSGGHFREARRAVECWLELDSGSVDTVVRWGGLLGASEILASSDDLARARELKHEVMEVARAHPDATLFGWSLGASLPATLADLSRIDVEEGELEAALAHAEEALEFRLRIGAPRGIAHAKAAMAQVRLARGELVAALEAFEESAALWRANGVVGDATLSDLGAVCVEIELGSVPAASRRVSSLLDDIAAFDDVGMVAYAAANAAAIATYGGDPETGATLLGASERIADDSGLPVFGQGEQAIWDRRRSVIQDQLGPEAFVRAHAAGGALERNELFVLVRSVVVAAPEAVETRTDA